MTPLIGIWLALQLAGDQAQPDSAEAHEKRAAAEQRKNAVEIRWPSGRQQTLANVAADQILTVREPL